MTFDQNFWQALADYGVQFPTLESLGSGNPPDKWIAEYNRVRADAFGSVLVTSTGTEGANASGLKQFPQATLIDALHCRRFELDPTYTLPVHLLTYSSERAIVAKGRRGFLMSFKPAS